MYHHNNRRRQPTPKRRESRATHRKATVVWRRILKIPHGRASQSTLPPPPETPTRRFHISREQGSVVLLESRESVDEVETLERDSESAVQQKHTKFSAAPLAVVEEQTSPIRKRPGAGARTFVKPQGVKEARRGADGPTAEVIQQFEKFSNDVENNEVGKTKTAHLSPSKVKPKVPKQRFRDRHPEQAAALGIKDPNAMDVDTDEYVYDTYVREIIMPDADGKIPVPQATIGLIVLTQEDEDWWYDEDESDREFDTDDEDSNAEEFYANDYPKDELASDDEFERDPYTYHHGDEE